MVHYKAMSDRSDTKMIRVPKFSLFDAFIPFAHLREQRPKIQHASSLFTMILFC